MSSLRNLEGEDLHRGLRELIISFESVIRDAGSLEQTEDILLHLEENDESFHKHDFIKALKRKLEEILSPLIDDELEKYSTTGHIDSGNQETLVSKITDSIIQSRSYGDLKKRLDRNVSEAVDFLLSNFDSEFGVGRTGLDGEGFDPRRTPVVTDDEEVSSFNSLCDQGSVMIFNHDYLKSIAVSLAKTQSLQSRREAMQKLNQIISGEIVQNKHWPQLRKNLLEVMADTDDHLSELCLKFVAKSFTCTSHHTSQVFTLLTEFLCQQCSLSLPSVSSGLNCLEKPVIKILKAFRLMIEFQQEAPNYWVRYPVTYLMDIVESSLSLLALQPAGQCQPIRMTPLHFVAILDPKAQWFIKWMHGNYSRKILLEHLKKFRTLIVTSVKQCLDFSGTRSSSSAEGINDVADSLSQMTLANGKRCFYTGPELEYALFIHSLSFLGRMLCFVRGREFFPVKLKEKAVSSQQINVSIGQLLKALVSLIVDSNNHPSPSGQTYRKLDLCFYDASKLVTEVFKSLCCTENVCTVCVCRDDILNTLLAPVMQYLDESSTSTPPSDYTLINVADILCVLASSSRGRRHLLYGEGQTLLSRTKSSPAHLIAEFTKRALMNKLPHSGHVPSNTVVGAYLYVCRQLYNTYEGLMVLSPYELHLCIAEVWKKLQATEKHSSSTSSRASSVKGDDGDKLKESFIESWKETLQDNLLNFGNTAKGILLLQQTGAFNECIRYMCHRYDKKLQVSKCEKFGYGVMVTQVAATAPGIQALQNTGYIKALLVELWSVLECGPQDIPVFYPKSWTVDPIERSSQKHFVRLGNILSAFPAVYELLKGEPLPSRDSYSFRDIPDSIMALIDRIIIVDSDAKIHSLFNYEQSYMFGLRVLSTMVSCLDTYLLLQSQYKFQEFLLSEQDSSKEEESDQIIWDALTLERNYILVKTYIIGGPTERSLPPRSYSEVKTEREKFPMLFSSYPIPREYQPNVAGRSAMKQAFVDPTKEKQDNDLSKFLNAGKSDKKPEVWMEKCSNLFYKLLVNKPEQAKGNLLQQLLEQSVAHMSRIQTEAVFHLFEFSGTDSMIKNFKLSPLQLLGVKAAVRYGIHLKVVNTSSESIENLTQLIKVTGCFLKQQQRPLKSSLRFLEGSYPGFDWFTATIFLVFHGNRDRTWNFLHKFSTLGASSYMWMARLHASLLPSRLLSSGIPPLFSSTAHNIELILQIELPLVASAFKMSGYTPSQICMHWLTQCFWNYLDWLDVVHYVSTCVVLGVDYQVYICIAVLRHLQKSILSHMQTQDLIIFLKEENISNFHIADNIKYFKELEVKYRKIVLPDMLNISKP